MLRALKLVAYGLASLVVIAIATPILFWAGRTQNPVETVFGDDEDMYDDDDPGEDVDE